MHDATKICGLYRASGESKDVGENFRWETVYRSRTVQRGAELPKDPPHGLLEGEYLGM